MVPSSRWLAPGLAVMLVAACAQGGSPGGERGPDGPGGRGGRGGPPDMAGGAGLGAMRSPDEARQWLVQQSMRQLVDARQALRVTPEQAPAWDAYAASVGALVNDLGRFESEPLDATSLQRIDRRVDRARNRYTALESVADSMRSLYAALSDEQRATADRVLAGTVPALYEGTPFAGGAAGGPPSRGPAMEGPQRRPGRGEPPR